MKYYEIAGTGTGTQADPYRPNLPAGMSFAGSDGQVNGGLAGKFLVAIKDGEADPPGATKIKKYEDLSSTDKAKIDAYKVEKAKPDTTEAKTKTEFDKLPADCLEKKAIDYKLAGGEDEARTWFVA